MEIGMMVFVVVLVGVIAGAMYEPQPMEYL